MSLGGRPKVESSIASSGAADLAAVLSVNFRFLNFFRPGAILLGLFPHRPRLLAVAHQARDLHASLCLLVKKCGAR
jgi:hypothetical protein